MSQAVADMVRFNLENVKELYTELFDLFVQSAQEDPVQGHVGGADLAIDRLMGTIEDQMKTFRISVEQAGGVRALPRDLGGEILQFNENLRGKLVAMNRSVGERMEQLRLDRDRIKEQLKKIQHKSQGARGYQRPIRKNSILQSEV
jgi:hypothetical protein